MGCRGMRGHIGIPGDGRETFRQKVWRKIYNRFWPYSEQLLDFWDFKVKRSLFGGRAKTGDQGPKGNDGPC